jgi:hypothetical protein
MSKFQSGYMGWKAHVVYEFIGVNRQTLIYWRDCLYPQYDRSKFSTYDILIYKIIKEYTQNYGIQLSRLKLVDWDSISMEIKKLTFSGHSNKILNIDLNNHSYKIYNSIDDIDVSSRHNVYIDIEEFSKSLIEKMINYGN